MNVHAPKTFLPKSSLYSFVLPCRSAFVQQYETSIKIQFFFGQFAQSLISISLSALFLASFSSQSHWLFPCFVLWFFRMIRLFSSIALFLFVRLTFTVVFDSLP
jgi:hypothetical protein